MVRTAEPAAVAVGVLQLERHRDQPVQEPATVPSRRKGRLSSSSRGHRIAGPALMWCMAVRVWGGGMGRMGRGRAH